MRTLKLLYIVLDAALIATIVKWTLMVRQQRRYKDYLKKMIDDHREAITFRPRSKR